MHDDNYGSAADQLERAVGRAFDLVRDSSTGRPFAVPKAGGVAVTIGRAVALASLGLDHIATEGACRAVAASLSAEAVLLKAPQVAIWHRAAPFADGYAVQLADDSYAVVTTAGWTLHAAPPAGVIFAACSTPLPTPAAVGELAGLWRHVRAAGANERMLVLAWLLHAWQPDVSCPLLLLTGPAGSAKTTSARRLASLADAGDHFQQIDGLPTVDVLKMAAKRRLFMVDNLSSVSRKSDLLATLVTGAGVTARELYSDDDEFVVRVRVAVILTGITVGVPRPDLASRIVPLELTSLSGHRTEADLDQEWSGLHAGLVAGLLDEFAGMLAVRPSVSKDGLARMADFHLTLRALDRIHGTNAEAAFLTGQHRSLLDAAASDLLAPAVESLLTDGPPAAAPYAATYSTDQLTLSDGAWSGATTAFWRALCEGKEGMPESPQLLGMKLATIAPILAARGVSVDRVRTHGRSVWRVQSFREAPPQRPETGSETGSQRPETGRHGPETGSPRACF